MTDFDPGDIPFQPQRQDDVAEQLRDLSIIAVRLGMYDAADVIARQCIPYCDECGGTEGKHYLRCSIWKFKS